MKKPSSISADAACSLVLPGLRTLTAFHQLLHLKDNEFLFVLGNHFVRTILRVCMCMCMCVSSLQGSQEVLLQLSAVYSVRLIIAAYSAEQLNLYLDAGEHVGTRVYVRVCVCAPSNRVPTVQFVSST